MNLMDALDNLLKLYNTPGTSNDDLEVAMKQYEVSLATSTDSGEIERITRLNEGTLITLPIDSGIAIYRRLLKLKRTPKLLRDFAYYLRLYGPFWDDEAEELLKEADEMESESNNEGTQR